MTYDIKCTWCGRFIALRDLQEGKATYEMILPDSHVSDETFEGECKKCKQNTTDDNVRYKI